MDMPDHIVQQAWPLVAVSGNGGVPPAGKNGTRFLVARDGLYREITLPWLRAVLPMGAGLRSATPYGPLEPCIDLLCGPLPVELIREFVRLARQELPNEAAAVIAWNPVTGAWRLAPRTPLQVSYAHIVYHEPALEEGEERVVDIHSHGHHDAFFSAEDDRDDHGSMKIAIVVGNLADQVNHVARLACVDRCIGLKVGADGSIQHEVIT